MFERFSAAIKARIANGVLTLDIIGHDLDIEGPFGLQRMIYADYAASGRALRQVEQFVFENVLPFYANPHTQASFCGRRINALRHEARRRVAHLCGADESCEVIFAGSGATAGIGKLVRLFGADRRNAQGRPALVLHGPFEHHSNLLPWRESGAEVCEVPPGSAGGVDHEALAGLLHANRGRALVCTFSAGSNVTGALSDIAEVTRIARRSGARIIWDHAGSAPYATASMAPAPDAGVDAIVLSPHKLVGGPGASGVLIVRRSAVVTERPSAAGGGTVRYVTPFGHDFCTSITAREEAGTPNAIGDIRAALALETVAAILASPRRLRQDRYTARALQCWSAHPLIEVLGDTKAPRLPIIAFRIHTPDGGLLHHQLVTRLLSDRFGIQARGGCACAGPYVHRLLRIDEDASAALRTAILAGDELAKPGFVRLNFSPLMSEETVDTIIAAVEAVAEQGPALSANYHADRTTAVFDWYAADLT